VTDYATDTVWRKGITEMTLDRDGKPQVGTKLREVLTLGGRRYVTDTDVTEVGPGMSYRFASAGNSGVVRGRRNVVEIAPESAVFTYDVELEPHAIPRIARRALAEMVTLAPDRADRVIADLAAHPEVGDRHVLVSAVGHRLARPIDVSSTRRANRRG
jgi:hypothetical protein